MQTNAEYKKSAEDFVNGLLQFLYVLLAMCLIISLIGIVNTLALSVFERTREIGMLRAVGMTRRQLRRVIRYESTITAIIGGLLGIVVGLLFGWIVAQGLADQGLVFVVPYSQLLHVPDRRDGVRGAGRDPARPPRRQAERAGSPAVRVA